MAMGVTRAGVMAGGQAVAASDVVGAVPHAVAGVQAPKAGPSQLFRGWAARRGTGRIGLARAATVVPAPWLLEPVRIDRVGAGDAVHLGAGIVAAPGRLSRWHRRVARGRGRRRRREGPKAARDLTVEARRGLAPRVEPVVAVGHALVGEGHSVVGRSVLEDAMAGDRKSVV